MTPSNTNCGSTINGERFLLVETTQKWVVFLYLTINTEYGEPGRTRTSDTRLKSPALPDLPIEIKFW